MAVAVGIEGSVKDETGTREGEEVDEPGIVSGEGEVEIDGEVVVELAVLADCARSFCFFSSSSIRCIIFVFFSLARVNNAAESIVVFAAFPIREDKEDSSGGEASVRDEVEREDDDEGGIETDAGDALNRRRAAGVRSGVLSILSLSFLSSLLFRFVDR